MIYNSAVLASMPAEKAFFATINQVAMRNLQTYGMAVDINH